MPRETNLAAAVKGICKGDIVVLFLPLSFYAKKKVAERKARIRGGGAKDARIREHMAAPVPPLMYLPLMTAQPIAKVFVNTRNGRLVRRLPFLKEKYHAYHLSLSESENSYTRIYSTIIQLIFSKGCIPHNGKPNFRPAIISVTLPEKDSLLSKFSPGLFQKAAYPRVPRRLSALFYKIILTVEMRCDIMECIL